MDFYGIILTPKLTHRGFAQSEKSQLQDNVEISKHLTLVGEQVLFNHLPSDASKRILLSSVSKFTVPEKLKPWYTYRNLWEEIRDDMKVQQIAKNYKFKEINNGLLEFDVVTNAFYAMLTTNGKDYWVLDYSQVLMLTDTIATRYLSLLYCYLETCLDISPMPTIEYLLYLYNWGDSLIVKHGNSAYSYIKDLEPISIAVFLNKWEKLEISSRVYQG